MPDVCWIFLCFIQFHSSGLVRCHEMVRHGICSISYDVIGLINLLIVKKHVYWDNILQRAFIPHPCIMGLTWPSVKKKLLSIQIHRTDWLSRSWRTEVASEFKFTKLWNVLFYCAYCSSEKQSKKNKYSFLKCCLSTYPTNISINLRSNKHTACSWTLWKSS